MTRRKRNFAGIFLLLGLLVAYGVVVSAIYEQLLTNAPVWILLAFFAVTGISWVFPAGALIKWMVRPDDVQD